MVRDDKQLKSSPLTKWSNLFSSILNSLKVKSNESNNSFSTFVDSVVPFLDHASLNYNSYKITAIGRFPSWVKQILATEVMKLKTNVFKPGLEKAF